MCTNLSSVYFLSFPSLSLSPPTSHRFAPPCSCAAGQPPPPSPSCVFLLSPFVSGSLLLTIKKLPICPWRRHNCHYYCCGPAHHTVYWLFRREGGGKHCLLCADATQYYHSVTTAHPHTHAQSLYLTLFSPLRLPVIFLLSTEQTWVSIGWKFIHRCLWKKKKKFNCQALGKHTLCHRQ